MKASLRLLLASAPIFAAASPSIAYCQSAADSSAVFRTLGAQFVAETKGIAALIGGIGQSFAVRESQIGNPEAERRASTIASAGLTIIWPRLPMTAEDKKRTLARNTSFSRIYGIHSVEIGRDTAFLKVGTVGYYPVRTVKSGWGFTAMDRRYTLKKIATGWRVSNVTTLMYSDGEVSPVGIR